MEAALIAPGEPATTSQSRSTDREKKTKPAVRFLPLKIQPAVAKKTW
jgi:hypothetical protein